MTLLVVLGIRRPGVQLNAADPLATLLGVLLVIAHPLFTAASTMGLLSVVAVLGWLSPAVTVFWAQALLHERLRPLQWLAAAAGAGAACCLALG